VLGQIATAYAHQRQATPDPTRLIIVDEADRLKTAGLEQVRDIFDRGELGGVLLGMPGLEKRLARYPQLYSRVGFVHAFRPLSAAQVRDLLQRQWVPAGVVLPKEGITDEEARTAIIRITGGNFRLLHRLLTQIARLVEINALPTVTRHVVETARESIVIGTA
jgi:DNA transposition AAA+ family ATPase